MYQPLRVSTEPFRYEIQATGGAELWNVTYGVQDHDNRYYIQFDVPDGSLRLNKYLDEDGVSIDSTGFSMSEDQWYEVEVDWATDGTHTVTLYDNSDTQVAQVSGSDSEWSSGEIGFDAYLTSGGTVYFDYVTLDGGDKGGGSSGSSGIIESFEDNSLSPYTFDRGSSGASIVQNPTKDESYALEIAGANTEMISTSGLSQYPSAGDTFSYWFQPTGGPEMLNITYGVQDHDNRYYAQADLLDGRFRLYRYDGGSPSHHESTSISLTEDEWYEIEIDWGTDGTHVATLFDDAGQQIAQVSGTDNTWTSGGIGFDAYLGSSGGTVYFDYVTAGLVTILGNFEEGLDGWSASGSNSLAQIDSTQQPEPVTRDQHALEVTVNSDPEPVIENQQRIQQADLTTNHCLLADVLPASVQGSNSPVTFRFRYHHSNPGGVEESPEMTVSQGFGGRICWNMSGLSSTKLANPDRLEIVWYPTNHSPGSGFDYNGVVYIDNVRLTDRQNRVTNARKMRKCRSLERARGLITNQMIQSETDTTQDGVYQFNDGANVSYHIEVLQNGNIEETLDGETFQWEVSE